MVADADSQDLGRYLRNLYWLDHNKGAKLLRPYWPLHVTVVRNELPPKRELWWNYDNERVEFTYTPYVRSNYTDERFRSFWWVDVRCERFDQIREELGLPPNPDRTYHMTIGTSEDEKNREAYEQMWADSGKTNT